MGVFKNCPRCFWLQEVKKVPQPRGIFPSLPGGVDRVMKTYYDTFRMRGELPSELEGKVDGELFRDQAQLDRWRNWRTGLVAMLQIEGEAVKLSGALDDLLVGAEGYSCLDGKSRGSAPKPGDSEKYYGHQLDAYGLLLHENKMPITGRGFLCYYWPAEMRTGKDGSKVGLVLASEVVELAVKPERTIKMLGEIVNCLKGPIPMVGLNCEYCGYCQARANEELALFQ